MPPPAETSKTPDSLLLPADLLGRTACVLIGVFFGSVGGGALYVLIAHRAGIRLLVAYELAAAIFLFGLVLLVWGLFAPRWLVVTAHHVTAHLWLVIAAAFLPFAAEAIWILCRGLV